MTELHGRETIVPVYQARVKLNTQLRVVNEFLLSNERPYIKLALQKSADNEISMYPNTCLACDQRYT